MKKYFRFLSLATIIAIVASLSLVAPFTAQAGILSDMQVALSSYDLSSLGDEVYVTMTANVTLATELTGSADDKVKVTFLDYDAAMENQFWLDETDLIATDVTLTCDPAGDNDSIEVASIVVDDGAGTASGSVTITTGDGGDAATCAAAKVLQIVITSSTTEIRTPYTAGSYRIKFETLTSAEALEDSGTAAVYINSVGGGQVLITGQVDPILTMSLNTNSCDLGVLTKDAYKSCSYNLTVGTNADLGYGAYIQSDGDLDDNITGAFIQREADATGSDGYINNDALLSESEYAIAVDTTDTTDVYPDFTSAYLTCADINGDTAPLDADVPVASLNDTTAQRLAYSNDPVDASTTGKTTICHVARISGAQESGNFTQTITITVVGNF